MSFAGNNYGKSKVLLGLVQATLSNGAAGPTGIASSSVSIPFAGSLAGLCMTTQGSNISAGSLILSVYDYGASSALGGTLTLSSGGQTAASFAPGLYTFSANDYLQIQYQTTSGFNAGNAWTFAAWVYI